jgi:hypothetical protein
MDSILPVASSSEASKQKHRLPNFYSMKKACQSRNPGIETT